MIFKIGPFHFPIEILIESEKKVGHHLEWSHIKSKMCSVISEDNRTRIQPVPEHFRHFAHFVARYCTGAFNSFLHKVEFRHYFCVSNEAWASVIMCVACWGCTLVVTDARLHHGSHWCICHAVVFPTELPAKQWERYAAHSLPVCVST